MALPINTDTVLQVIYTMAAGPETEYLIESYKRSIEKDQKQLEQLDQVIDGIKIVTEVDNEPTVIIEGVNDQINRFDPSTKGLDNRILTLNSQIRDLQEQIVGLGQSANVFGCVGLGTTVTSVIGDQVNLHIWSFTSPNPFSQSQQVLTANNLGVGTYNGISTVSIGTYANFASDDGVDCAGYATSISNLQAQITPLRTQRNEVITEVNILKEERARYQLQKYGYDVAKVQLEGEITKKQNLIIALEDPDNQQWFLE